MKINFIVLVILSLSWSLVGQRYEAKDFYFKGPIKKVVELEFDSEKEYLDHRYNTMDTIIFRNDGSLKYNRRYRNNGELLVEEKVELNQSDNIRNYSKYQLGLKFREERFDYDTTENFMLKSTYEDDKLQRIYKMIKDANNKVTKVETYNSENQLVSTNNIGTGTINEMNRANENARRHEITQYANYYEKVERNQQGIKKAYWKLDNNDNILVRTFFHDNGSIRNNSIYELDKYGNWTKETFEAEGQVAISVRTIEYYIEE